MGYFIYTLCVTSGIISTVLAAPSGGLAVAASAHLKPPITYSGGNFGVNFGGYSAAAGLGGLLTGDASQGGLHAEAGTPHGQGAAAGLGGAVGGGGSAGGLYAAADSGAGAAAAAEISGSKSVSGSFGGSVASASSGEAYVSKVVEHHASPVVVEKTVQGTPTVQKTYVERTVIPNYVEKTIQVPSYVEKTIRVPTVVEQKVRVAAAPTIIEKTVDVPTPQVQESAAFSGGVEGGSAVHAGGAYKVIQKSHPFAYRKHWAGGFGSGYSHPGFFGGPFVAGGGGAGFGAGSFGGFGGGGSSDATLSYTKTANPQLITDAFNVPISTLGAVSKLVGGIFGGGGGGSLSVSKHYSAY